MNQFGDDLYTSPAIDDEPRGQMPPRRVIFGVCFVLSAGIATKLLLPYLGRLYDVAYAVGLIAAAAGTAVVLHSLRRGGAR